MIIYKEPTFADAYKKSLIDLLNIGQSNSARGTSSKELLNVCLEIEDPTSCIYDNTHRSSQYKYISAELLWYFSGRNDLDFIKQYASFWEKISNPDGTCNSAYGNLIFTNRNEQGLNQYSWALQSLLRDSNTRQAIMHFNLPRHQHFDNKDFVCTMYSIFHIRDNKLHQSVFMRSNDCILGTPTDVPFFCTLQIQMLQHLKETMPNLELGTYTHVANSYHVYDRHYELVKKMIDSDFIPVSLPTLDCELITNTGAISHNLSFLMQHRHSPNYASTSEFLSALHSNLNP